MGFLPDHPTDNMIMIRTALLACTAALAAADADPLYGYAGHHLGYGAAHLGYSSLGYGHGYGHGYFGYGKRGADAEPKADANALYGTYGGYGLGHRAYGYGNLGYSSLGYGHGYGHGYYGYGKREADAEPKADANALYGTYGGYGLGHH